MKPMTLLTMAAFALGLSTTLVTAEDAWAPFELNSVKDGKATTVMFEPVTKVSKKWNICILIPHLKDSYWVAAGYGLIEEIKRLGLSATMLQAGGFDDLPKQLSQFDDCMASGADAILVAAISEAGVSAKIAEALAKGIPTVSFINPIIDVPVTSKIFVDHPMKGFQTGKYLVEKMGEAGGNVVAFPGPQGSGWAERYLEGFTKALEGTKVKILDTKFGDAGVAEQLRLVEDALQTYPDLNAIWGTAPTAEAAIGAVKDAGRDDVLIMASYENQATLDAMNAHEIIGFATEYPVMQGRIAVDLAIKALEKTPIDTHYVVVPKMITNDIIKDIDINQVLAPAGWQPVFSVN